MKDFWLSCGHHLLDRDAGGGLVVTDEFLKAYLARPELAPPPEACVVERTLHAALLADPRRPVGAADIAAIADADARENWDADDRFPRPSARAPDPRGGLSGAGAPRRGRHAAAVRQPARARDPAQYARRLRRRLRAAGRRAVLPSAADHAARRRAARRRRGTHRRQQSGADLAAGVDARPGKIRRHRRAGRRQCAGLFRAQRRLRHGARPDRRAARARGARAR